MPYLSPEIFKYEIRSHRIYGVSNLEMGLRRVWGEPPANRIRLKNVLEYGVVCTFIPHS